jgi:hypothetical protein
LQLPLGFSVTSSTDLPSGVVEIAEQPANKTTDSRPGKAIILLVIIYFLLLKTFSMILNLCQLADPCQQIA